MKEVYILIIEVEKEISIVIGTLGRMRFKKGEYIYAGSGQNNARKMIQMHYSDKKKTKHHIDYLLKDPHVTLKKAIYKKGAKEEECRIASIFNITEEPVKNFGSGDCSCYSHLFRLKTFKYMSSIEII